MVTLTGRGEDALAPGHLNELLSGSGIAADVVAERGYRTVHSREAAALLSAGFNSAQRTGSGWIAPLISPVGATEAIFKPDAPRQIKGKTLKYEYPSGHGVILDVHPRTW